MKVVNHRPNNKVGRTPQLNRLSTKSFDSFVERSSWLCLRTGDNYKEIRNDCNMAFKKRRIEYVREFEQNLHGESAKSFQLWKKPKILPKSQSHNLYSWSRNGQWTMYLYGFGKSRLSGCIIFSSCSNTSPHLNKDNIEDLGPLTQVLKNFQRFTSPSFKKVTFWKLFFPYLWENREVMWYPTGFSGRLSFFCCSLSDLPL